MCTISSHLPIYQVVILLPRTESCFLFFFKRDKMVDVVVTRARLTVQEHRPVVQPELSSTAHPLATDPRPP